MIELRDIHISNATYERVRRLMLDATRAGVTPPRVQPPVKHPGSAWYVWLLQEALRRGLRDLENDHAAGQLF